MIPDFVAGRLALVVSDMVVFDSDRFRLAALPLM
jgi:hypothetical protein